MPKVTQLVSGSTGVEPPDVSTALHRTRGTKALNEPMWEEGETVPGVFEGGDFSIDTGKLLPQDPQGPRQEDEIDLQSQAEGVGRLDLQTDSGLTIYKNGTLPHSLQ